MTDLPLPEPDGWIFQNSETWMMCEVTNDGVNNAENFAANNPRHELVDSFYLSRHLREAAAKTAALQAECARLRAFIDGRFVLCQFNDTGRWAALTELGYLATGECASDNEAIDAALRGKEAP